ncbi:MAG: hypothetical protein H6656_15240 [Ardenticatenaceae bacterium]|nr:hypothetical protein [Ardenticatenaceae bacterium]
MNQQELRQLIDRAAAEEWTELNLNNQELIQPGEETVIFAARCGFRS